MCHTEDHRCVARPLSGIPDGGLSFSEQHVLDFQRGDEDDTFTCRVWETNNQKPVSLSFFISGELVDDDGNRKDLRMRRSDTSDYPDGHTFFCHAPDKHTPSVVSHVVESLFEEPSRTIEDMLQKLLTVLARKLSASQDDDDTDEEMDDGFVDYDGDSDDGLGTHDMGKKIDHSLLQRCGLASCLLVRAGSPLDQTLP